ncbi:MAG: RluA family pseudouridine synthase [Planctomycetia bacterium]
MPEPQIIRESSGVVAVWKPAGLATQAPPGIPSVEAWLRQALHGQAMNGYLGVPHRLDRSVSGVVLFASTPRAARKLSRQFERRQVSKSYRAIVAPAEAAGEAVEAIVRAAGEPGGTADGTPAGTVTWRDRLEKLPAEARARIVAADEPGGREAVTIVSLLRRLPADRLLLELSPVTGRMHQLRLQAAARGMPIVGDDLYGVPDPAWNRSWTGQIRAGIAVVADSDDQRTQPIALHACRITYADPDTGEAVTIEAALPAYWPESARTGESDQA